MDREGEGREYESYHIPKETEAMWADELIAEFLKSEKQGKEALRAYAAVTELVNRDRTVDAGERTGGDCGSWEDTVWDRCLYYPLRAENLDDVTILFMLPCSFRMAEKAVKKHRFSREEADAYLQVLGGYIRQVRARAEDGTITRAADFTMQEFSDPVYVADYLNDLAEKWAGLFI